MICCLLLTVKLIQLWVIRNLWAWLAGPLTLPSLKWSSYLSYQNRGHLPQTHSCFAKSVHWLLPHWLLLVRKAFRLPLGTEVWMLGRQILILEWLSKAHSKPLHLASQAQVQCSWLTYPRGPCRWCARFWVWYRSAVSGINAQGLCVLSRLEQACFYRCFRSQGPLCNKSRRFLEFSGCRLACVKPSLGRALPWSLLQTSSLNGVSLGLFFPAGSPILLPKPRQELLME